MKKTTKNRYAGLAQEVKDWTSGKMRLRTSMLNDDGTRTVWEESGPEEKARLKRLARFKAMRADLGVTQAQMAAALHVALKTLQGWEIGKPIPEVAYVLAEVLHDVPAVRRKLLVAA